MPEGYALGLCRGYYVFEHSLALHKQHILQDRRPIVCKMFPELSHHGMIHYFRRVPKASLSEGSLRVYVLGRVFVRKGGRGRRGCRALAGEQVVYLPSQSLTSLREAETDGTVVCMTERKSTPKSKHLVLPPGNSVFGHAGRFGHF